MNRFYTPRIRVKYAILIQRGPLSPVSDAWTEVKRSIPAYEINDHHDAQYVCDAAHISWAAQPGQPKTSFKGVDPGRKKYDMHSRILRFRHPQMFADWLFTIYNLLNFLPILQPWRFYFSVDIAVVSIHAN